MKPRIFIGSSTEGLDVARFIQTEFNKDFECILWNDGEVFGENTSYLDSLLKAASMFDFGILVATKDDKTKKRKGSFETPRDNVIFEFGLFIGRLGKNRTFVIQEKGVALPSDLLGIQISDFERTLELSCSKSLSDLIIRFKKIITEKFRLQELGLLPSTGVAMGYYKNFVERICDYLSRANTQVEVEGVLYNKFEVNIIIPAMLESDMKSKAEFFYNSNGFKEITIDVKDGGRPIGMRYSLAKKNEGILQIVDMATTLSPVFDAIKMYLQVGHLGVSREQELISIREINNFKAALASLVNQKSNVKALVKFIDE